MEREKYYYRVSQQSELSRVLNELLVRGLTCLNEASKMAGTMFKADSFTPSTGCAMGGIGQLFFKRKPTARRWEVLGKTEDGLYCAIPNPLTRSGCMAVSKIATLPIVKNSEVIKAFGINAIENTKLPKFFPIEGYHIYIEAEYPIENEDLITVSNEEYETALNYYETGLRL